ncbi:MAG: prefoldin subunit beta [Candidatus Woesearchaeota archaeon]
MKKETEEKISQLQNIEQNINTLIGQKQQFQSQNLEIENALSQIETTERVFRIIGNIMVESTKEESKKDLNEKKEVIALRLKTIEKQEEKLRQKANELQQEVLKEMNN